MSTHTGIERIFPHEAPTPRGPYSPAVRAGDFLYVSGQGPVDPLTDKLSTGDIQHETRLTLSNLKRILESCGASMSDVVKCSVFLRDRGDFQPMNAAYAEFFGEHTPARTTVICELPADMRIEIDCIAYRPANR